MYLYSDIVEEDDYFKADINLDEDTEDKE